MKLSPLLFAPSMRRHAGQTATRLLMSAANPSSAPPYPPWLQLRAVADYSERQHITSRVSDAIPKSGGFLSNANLLSDLVTTMMIEDIQPVRLSEFQSSLERIEGLSLDSSSVELFEDCCHQVDETTNDKDIPKCVNGILQLNWRNAPGKLSHTIVADG